MYSPKANISTNKTLYKTWSQYPSCAILRDTRLRQFEDQVIAILESNTHDGSTFFNYTNYSMDREILP